MANFYRRQWISGILVALLSAGASLKANGIQFSSRPTIRPNPNESVPLAAIVHFQTQVPVSAVVTVFDGENQWQHEYGIRENLKRQLPVLGLRPGRSHRVQLEVKDFAGDQTATETLTFESPSLPSDPDQFPSIEVLTCDSKKAEPGLRLFNPRRRIPRQTQAGNAKERKFGESFGMLLIVDQKGVPVWYYKTDSRIAGFDRLPDGNLLYVTADFRIVEIDLLGNVQNEWFAMNRPSGSQPSAISVDALTFHHDADKTANGDLIALSSQRKRINSYYTSETNKSAPRQDQWVMGDRIVLFSPDGNIKWDWNAFDHLPVRRIGYETFSTYWQRRGFPDTIDWSHANEVTKLDDGDVLVNFRYQSAIVKIDGDSGKIKWIFGEPTGWPESLRSKLIDLKGDVRWPWHQHAPTFTSRGTLLLFDNGNYRARPFEEPLDIDQTWSRAVEYKINEQNLTAEQIWTSESASDSRLVTIAMGSALETPKHKNVLVGYGAVLDPERLDEITWETRARIDQLTRCREYTHSKPSTVVWELALNPTGEDPTIGWTIFGCRPTGVLTAQESVAK